MECQESEHYTEARIQIDEVKDTRDNKKITLHKQFRLIKETSKE